MQAASIRCILQSVFLGRSVEWLCVACVIRSARAATNVCGSFDAARMSTNVVILSVKNSRAPSAISERAKGNDRRDCPARCLVLRRPVLN